MLRELKMLNTIKFIRNSILKENKKINFAWCKYNYILCASIQELFFVKNIYFPFFLKSILHINKGDQNKIMIICIKFSKN